MTIFYEDNDDLTDFEALAEITENTPPEPSDTGTASDGDGENGVFSAPESEPDTPDNDDGDKDDADGGEDGEASPRAESEPDDSDYLFDSEYLNGTILNRRAKIPERPRFETNTVFKRIQAAVGAIFGASVGVFVCALLYYGYIDLFVLLCAAVFVAALYITSLFHIAGRIISGLAASGRFIYARIFCVLLRIRGGKHTFTRTERKIHGLDSEKLRTVAVMPAEGDHNLAFYIGFYCGGAAADIIFGLICLLSALLTAGKVSALLYTAACAALVYTLYGFIPRFNGLAPRDGLILLSLLTGSPASADMIKLDSIDISLSSGLRPSELRDPNISLHRREYIATADSGIRHSTVDQAGQIRLPISEGGGGRFVAVRMFFDRLPDYFLSVVENIRRLFVKSKPVTVEEPQAEPVQAETVQPEPVQSEPAQPEPAQSEPARDDTERAIGSAPEPIGFITVAAPLCYAQGEAERSPYGALLNACEYLRALDNPEKFKRFPADSESCERLALLLEERFEYLPGVFRERFALELCAFYSFYGNFDAAHGFYSASLSFPNERNSLSSLRCRSYYDLFVKKNVEQALKLSERALTAVKAPREGRFRPYAGCLKMESELLEYVRDQASRAEKREESDIGGDEIS